MPIYNKLVRDRIPEIIHQSGKQYRTKILDDEMYQKELKRKLQEELQEYLEAATDSEALEELADIMELIHALAHIHQGSIEEVEEIRLDKLKKRGGFVKKIYLIEVIDE